MQVEWVTEPVKLGSSTSRPGPEHAASGVAPALGLAEQLTAGARASPRRAGAARPRCGSAPRGRRVDLALGVVAHPQAERQRGHRRRAARARRRAPRTRARGVAHAPRPLAQLGEELRHRVLQALAAGDALPVAPSPGPPAGRPRRWARSRTRWAPFMRLTIRTSASASSICEHGFIATSSAQAPGSSSDSVAPGRARVEGRHPARCPEEEGQADRDPEARPQVVGHAEAVEPQHPRCRWGGTRRRPSAAPSTPRTRTRCWRSSSWSRWRCSSGMSRSAQVAVASSGLGALRHLAHLTGGAAARRPPPAPGRCWASSARSRRQRHLAARARRAAAAPARAAGARRPATGPARGR